MKVNLKELKAGDTVKLLTSDLEVDGVLVKGDIVEISFKGFTTIFAYYKNGRFDDSEKTPFDIIEIIPAPFDWSTVKAGDAFIDEEGKICWYAYPFHKLPEHVIIYTDRNIKYGEACRPRSNFKENLTRAPEHDMELEE